MEDASNNDVTTTAQFATAYDDLCLALQWFG
jgi:hypothetical protein